MQCIDNESIWKKLDGADAVTFFNKIFGQFLFKWSVMELHAGWW